MEDQRGPCLVCGASDSAYFAGHGNGPFCADHGFSVARGLTAIEKAKRDIELEVMREKGRTYWAKRGIKVGSAVQARAMSMLGPFGGSLLVRGIAKVGAAGAYVLADQGKGKQRLMPDYFGPA